MWRCYRSLEDTEIDKNGCLPLLVVQTDDCNFKLLNRYDSNREKELLKTLTELKNTLDVSGIYTKQIILGGDFNFCFDFMLETKGGNPA